MFLTFTHHHINNTHQGSFQSLHISLNFLFILSKISSYLAQIISDKNHKSIVSSFDLGSSTNITHFSLFILSASFISNCNHIDISLVTSSHQTGSIQYITGYHSSYTTYDV
jgi:hypothetical protein